MWKQRVNTDGNSGKQRETEEDIEIDREKRRETERIGERHIRTDKQEKKRKFNFIIKDNMKKYVVHLISI